MAWFLLFLAGIFEIVWAIGLKYSEGFSKLWPSVITVIAMVSSIYLLALALKELPIGVAYSIWTGIGAVGTLIVGILYFGDSASIWRLLSASLIVIGIVGLKLAH